MASIWIAAENRALAATQCDRLEALRREVAGRAAKRGLFDLMGAADDGWLGARPEILGDPTIVAPLLLLRRMPDALSMIDPSNVTVPPVLF